MKKLRFTTSGSKMEIPAKERITMFSWKRLFAAVVISISFLGMSAANAQNRKCFTLSSLQGDYAVVATYGANVAMSFGTRSYDGNGNLTATFLVNEPTPGSTTGARTIV